MNSYYMWFLSVEVQKSIHLIFVNIQCLPGITEKKSTLKYSSPRFHTIKNHPPKESLIVNKIR